VSIVAKWNPFARPRQSCAGTSSHSAESGTGRGRATGGITKSEKMAAARGSPESAAFA